MFTRLLAGLAVGLLFTTPVFATDSGVWLVPSPDHEQTFASGTEMHRAWAEIGRHLVVFLDFTNDPYVDRQNPRQYDKFSFAFPQVTLGANGRVFYCREGGHAVPVAVKASGLFGLDEVRLLPNAVLRIRSPHGYLSLALQLREGNGVAVQ